MYLRSRDKTTMTTLPLISAPGSRRSEAILLTILWVLFLGPPIAAVFLATGLPLVADAGWLARDLLSTYICPTPARSYQLLQEPMAVCARCWGATIGLWGGYLLSSRMAGPPLDRFFLLRWDARLALAALPFLLWIAEIAWWPTAPLWVLLLNGTQAGIAAGLFFCSIWPGIRWPAVGRICAE